MENQLEANPADIVSCGWKPSHKSGPSRPQEIMLGMKPHRHGPWMTMEWWCLTWTGDGMKPSQCWLRLDRQVDVFSNFLMHTDHEGKGESHRFGFEMVWTWPQEIPCWDGPKLRHDNPKPKSYPSWTTRTGMKGVRISNWRLTSQTLSHFET